MKLLERHTQLEELDAALRDAAAGRGSVVIVTGEAGAGKTSLVTEFATNHAGTEFYFGLCDDLITPRPLGPFRDMFGQLIRAMPIQAESGMVVKFLEAIIEELKRPPHPAVVVVDDAHWADAATLDAIRFLGRRVGRLRTLLMVTYRDDEVPADHPLRRSLGAIPGQDLRRVSLGPLSRDAVSQLAGAVGTSELYELTRGNPFFVHEVLMSPQVPVPPTVQDAVIARVARLAADARDCVDLVSVVPSNAEWWLIDECGVANGVREAQRLGVLRVESGSVSFSHELARRAVERSLDENRRQELNRQVLTVLSNHHADVARLAHHAVQANVAEAIVALAPMAGRRAASLEAHREAADHFERALQYSTMLPDSELADLLYEYAYECYLAGRHEPADAALKKVVKMRAGAGDYERLGESLTLLSDVQWFRGRGEDAEDSVRKAIVTLEKEPPGTALARAYAQRAKLAMVAGRASEAVELGAEAIELARKLADCVVLAQAMDTAGCAQWVVPPFDNSVLIDSLGVAKKSEIRPAVARAYHNIADGYINFMQYEQAEPYLAVGLAYCEANDLIGAWNNMLTVRAQWNLDQGRWDEAAEDVHSVLHCEDVSRIGALAVLGILQTRRGDPDARQTIDQALQLAEMTLSIQHLLNITATKAELAWLSDDPAPTNMTAAVRRAVEVGPAPWVSRAAFWLQRQGAMPKLRDDLQEPYALQAVGRWEDAARYWFELGLPYERASALADAQEPMPLLEALEILNQLGAVPLATKVRRRLSAMGVSSIPRGPRTETRANAAGLTPRQAEVLRLLAKGLTYQEIADRLIVSVKTVDRHLSAVRQKLGVNRAADAIEKGRTLGILDAEDGERPGRNSYRTGKRI